MEIEVKKGRECVKKATAQDVLYHRRPYNARANFFSAPEPIVTTTPGPPAHARVLYGLVAMQHKKILPLAQGKTIVYPRSGATLLQAGLTGKDGALGLYPTPLDAIFKCNKTLVRKRAKEPGIAIKIAKAIAWNAGIHDQPGRCPSSAARYYSFVQIKEIENLPITASSVLYEEPACLIPAMEFPPNEDADLQQSGMGATLPRKPGPGKPSTTSLQKAQQNTERAVQDVLQMERQLNQARGL